MANRTTTSRVAFFRPFRLAEMERVQPAELDVIETDSEQIDGLAFAALRRTPRYILVPRQAGSSILSETVSALPQNCRLSWPHNWTRRPPEPYPGLMLDDLLAGAIVQMALSSAHQISLSHFGEWETKMRLRP